MKKGKMWLLLVSLLVSVSVMFCGCGGGSTSKSSGEQSSSQKKDVPIISQDVLNKAIADTKKEFEDTNNHPMVKDTAIQVDGDNLVMVLVYGDAVNDATMLDELDSFIRRFAANVNLYDNKVAPPGGKEYWGGVYDAYGLDVRLARQRNASDQSKWELRDVVAPGVQGHHKFTLK